MYAVRTLPILVFADTRICSVVCFPVLWRMKVTQMHSCTHIHTHRVVKVKRHEDAVQEDNTEELSREEEEEALKEEEEEERKFQRWSHPGHSTRPMAAQQDPATPGGGVQLPMAPAPLPAGWEMHFDPNTQRNFFYNSERKTSQWERPQHMPVPPPPDLSHPAHHAGVIVL